MPKVKPLDITTLFVNSKVADEFRISFNDIKDAKLEGVTFLNGSYSGSGAGELELVDSKFVNSSLVKSVFYDSKFKHVEFQNCKFEELEITGCRLEQVTFTNCELFQVFISRCSVSGLRFQKCNLITSSFNDSTVEKLVISECTITPPFGGVWGAEKIDVASLDVLRKNSFKFLD